MVSYIGPITFLPAKAVPHPGALAVGPTHMTTELHTATLGTDPTAIWQAEDSGFQALDTATTGTPGVLTLNISSLPAPDQSRIWTFIEFMPEYSQTHWRLVSHADADIWIVDWRAENQQPGSNQTRAVVRIIDEHCVTHTEVDQITRPLQMADFATLLQRLEARLGQSCAAR